MSRVSLNVCPFALQASEAKSLSDRQARWATAAEGAG